MRWAGIGSTRLDEKECRFCWWVGWLMAKHDWELVTGAAVGADQAYAEGTLYAGGSVVLELPWSTYEKKWVDWARSRGAKIRTLPAEIAPDSIAAYQSVDRFHNKPKALRPGARRLHARNFNIICGWQGKQPVDLVIAWPKVNQWGHLGGTGQGLRIAQHYGIPTEILGHSDTRKKIQAKIRETYNTAR